MEVQERTSCIPVILNPCWCCAFRTGDAVEGVVKGALHLGNKDKNKKKGGGGIFSRTGGDKDKKKVDKGEGGLFNREDEEERKSGFKGLFAEGPLPEAGGGGGAAMEGEPQSASANDGGTYEEQDCTSLRHVCRLFVYGNLGSVPAVPLIHS